MLHCCDLPSYIDGAAYMVKNGVILSTYKHLYKIQITLDYLVRVPNPNGEWPLI